MSGLEPQTAGTTRIKHSAGSIEAARVVVCAGPWADRLAVAAGAGAEPRIVPFRGAYLRLRPERSHLVRANIYPVPDPDLPFLGMHLTRNPAGEVLLGPTALFAGARDAYELRRVRRDDLWDSLSWPGTWRLFRRFWRTGAAEMRHAASRRSFVTECRRYVPELTAADVEPSAHSGVAPGRRQGRLAHRRLRGRADGPHSPRPQRPFAGGDVLARPGGGDRRPRRRPRSGAMSSPARPTREQLLAFLPTEVADHVLASEEDLLAGRRLEVSVLSCDVSGFRGLVASHPDEALVFLNGLLAEIAAAIEAELGTLMSFPGDGALAVFGARSRTPGTASGPIAPQRRSQAR